MIFSELIRKWFNIEKPECSRCDLYRDIIDSERKEKGEYYNRLMHVLNVGYEGVPAESPGKAPVSVGGIQNWRAKQRHLARVSAEKAGNKTIDDVNNEIERVEVELAGLQGRGKTKASE